MTLSVGPTNTSTYRRLLDILFAPEEPTNYPNGLHTEAA
jgi:hypothetical protein